MNCQLGLFEKIGRIAVTNDVILSSMFGISVENGCFWIDLSVNYSKDDIKK